MHAEVLAKLTVSISFRGQLHELELMQGETIFAAAHRAGLDLPFSCLGGYCGACSATLESGEVAMRVNHSLRAKQLARGLILACQAVPKSADCHVRFDDE
jgi:3-ketosteroid 9alpha-monooxygenase subunit B